MQSVQAGMYNSAQIEVLFVQTIGLRLDRENCLLFCSAGGNDGRSSFETNPPAAQRKRAAIPFTKQGI
jgi:hypothetical protein